MINMELKSKAEEILHTICGCLVRVWSIVDVATHKKSNFLEVQLANVCGVGIEGMSWSALQLRQLLH